MNDRLNSSNIQPKMVIAEHGKCFICGQSVEFLIEEGFSLREAYCPSCGGSKRNRDIAKAIVMTFLAKETLSLAEALEGIKDLKIYNAQSIGPVHDFLSKLPGYTCSEYFDDVTRGSTNESGIRCEDLQRLTFNDDSFDLVITQDVFEHIANPKKAFLEVYRVLKPDGFHIFTVPIHEERKTVSRTNLPPVYHDDPIRETGSLVYTDFGEDIIDYLKSFGIPVKKVLHEKFYSSDAIPSIDDKASHKMYVESRERSEMLKFFKYNSVVFRTKKQSPKEDVMEITGERFIPELDSPQISYEHWHRYLYATQFVKGKVVLDIACGEGYGSFMLSENAEKVVGIDIDSTTINHASSKYIKDNLEFKVGSTSKIPIDGQKFFDVIVSFETIEHISEEEQKQFMAEVKRLLKPEGLFIVSTPNKLLYSDVPAYKNEYHVKEFYIDEFRSFLKDTFRNVNILGQKVYPVSYIWDPNKKRISLSEYSLRYTQAGFRPSTDPKDIIYAIAICTNKNIMEDISASILIDLSQKFFMDNAAQIQSLEVALKHKDEALAEMRSRLEEEQTKKQKEREQLQASIQELHVELQKKEQMLLEKQGEREQLQASIQELHVELQKKEQMLLEKQGEREQLQASIQGLQVELEEKIEEIKLKGKHIKNLYESYSWRVTAPLRKVHEISTKWLRTEQKKEIKTPLKKNFSTKKIFRNISSIIKTYNFKQAIPNIRAYGLKTFFHNAWKEITKNDQENLLNHSIEREKSEIREAIDLHNTGNIPQHTQKNNYFHYLSEINNCKGKDYVPISFPDIPKTDIKLIAFYLPQFHPIPENDDWWGAGFTEWTSVTRAIPQFIGHYQPRLPGELGFYDLRIPEVQKRQIELAKQYGIYGFCFHFYWFNGKRLLEMPLEQFVSNPEIDFPFCINWANENWTRRWDGKDKDILIAQNHSPEDDINFIHYISKYLKDDRYIRINSKPLLIVYRPALLPKTKETSNIWRQWCHKNGIGDIYLALTHSYEHIDPGEIGFDAAIEFAPNTFPLKDIKDLFVIVNDKFQGRIFDYHNAIDIARNYREPHYKKFRGLCPSWDNEPRRPGRGTILVNSSPEAYKEWLKMLCDYTIKNFEPEERLIFLNAWNEWAEGTYMEPDRRYGYAYLQTTAEVLSSFTEKTNGIPDRWKILFVSHDACKAGAQSVLINIISWFKKHTFINLKILCLKGGEWLYRFRELGDTLVLSELKNKEIHYYEEDLLQTLRDFCGGSPDLIYGNSVATGGEYRLLKLLNAPIITHFHELEMSIKRYAADWIDDVFKYSSHFIACSNAVRENIVKNKRVEQSRITTIYSFISPDTSIQISSDSEKRQIRKRLGIEENKFLVFGCGVGMVFRKGADLFIKVARTLLRKGYDGFHFYWIGDLDNKEHDEKYGSWSDHLIALKKDGFGRYVTFLGKRDNPREYLQAGDIFLLPSREDPFPLVVLEAAECGLPVICFSDAGGMPEFVGDDAGFVVPYEDVEAMAEKIALLMENGSLNQKLGTRAREKLLSGFTIEQTVPHILSTCRKVVRKNPTVSVIVPNYNHARYLPKRIDSIFKQTFKDFEVILLDDASTDKSIEILEKYAHYADVRIVRNDQNTGSPCKQWLKGIDLARADIIWIAEADDACEPQFLETLLPVFRDPAVRLAYVDSYAIDENDRITGDYVNCEYLTSLSKNKWKMSYQVSATEEINDGLGVKNTILNISAVLFRKFSLNEEVRKILEKMRVAGDWFFIVNAIKDGKLYYEARKLNYHRRHSESVIGKTISDKKIKDFFHEFYTVQHFIFNNYELTSDFPEKWETYLRKQWNDFHPDKPFEKLKEYYPVDEIKRKIYGKTKKSYRKLKNQEDCSIPFASNIQLLREFEGSISTFQDLSSISIKKLSENVSDEFYFWLLTEGYRHIENQALMSFLPNMPDEKTQTTFTGRKGNAALEQAFRAFTLFKNIAKRYGIDLRECHNILDFGCGWGRIIRFFLKDVEESGLYGADCNQDVINICKQSNIKANFELINIMPPIRFPDNMFDIVYLYSVFSHLSEEACMKWLAEFQRVLRPGGIVIATTRSRRNLANYENLHKAFIDIEQTLLDYDNGKFCHSPTGGSGVLDKNFYGETAIPKKYVEEKWTKYFPVIEFIHDTEHKSFDQNVIIAQKADEIKENFLENNEIILNRPERVIGSEETHFHVNGPIIVYNMGKVGSLSVHETLVDLQLSVPVHHGHVLHNLEKMAENIKKQRANPANALAVIKQGKELRRLIDSDLSQKWNIISLVRDPIAVNISRFFHGIEGIIPDIHQQMNMRTLAVEDLINIFLNKWDPRGGITWFDTQFKPVFGIDVYSRPFPIKRGYDIFREGRFSLLLIRLEDLDVCAGNALRKFLGITDIKLKKSNVGANKWYKDIYGDFVSKIILPDEYIDEMYNSKFTQHFYSHEEIEAFRAKWTRHKTAIN